MAASDFFNRTIDTIKYRFDLSEDQDFAQDVIADIDRGIVFKGTNLWALIFSIMVASVGLNMNSTAVVIGAMLISPLMGPIMGLGLGAGIYDMGMINKAAKNLGIMVVVSLVTSALYFAITPIKAENTELLGRTVPTIWDVLIAFFGGLAGIVAGTRREKGNAVAGVAIATALMPPICTAGWGLATLQFTKFAGAMYLFTINMVMISASCYLVVRLLRFPIKEFLSEESESKVRKYVGLIVFLTVIPSIYLGYGIVRKAVLEQKINTFINQECEKISGTDLVKSELNLTEQKLHLYFLGEPLSIVQMKNIEEELGQYDLKGIDLIFHQGSREAQAQLNPNEVRVGIIEDLYKKNEEALRTKDGQIELLERELMDYTEIDKESGDVVREMKALYPGVLHFSMNRNRLYDLQTDSVKIMPLAVIHYKGRLQKNEKDKIEHWLKVRLKADTVAVVFQ